MGRRRRHVLGDLFEHATLRTGQDEAMTGQKRRTSETGWCDERSRRDVEIGDVKVVANPGRGRFESLATKRQQQLQAKQLVKGETSPRGAVSLISSGTWIPQYARVRSTRSSGSGPSRTEDRTAAPPVEATLQ